jgi:hypothetical protein
MDAFFPFIHKIEKKKNEELQPLYVELEPPPPEYKEKEESEDSPRIVIIQL